jgi:hypothetical protein
MLTISAQALPLWEEATDPEELVWEMNRLEGWDRVWPPPNGDLLPASTSGNSALTTASTAGSIAAR